MWIPKGKRALLLLKSTAKNTLCKSIINGTAKVNIPGLGVRYNITGTSGDAKYVSMTKKGNITVIPNMDVNLYICWNVVMIYHDGTRLVAKLTDYQGRPIVNATIYFIVKLMLKLLMIMVLLLWDLI